MYGTCVCSDQETVVRTMGRTELWGGSMGSETGFRLRKPSVALDPPPHANSVTLGELLSLPEASCHLPNKDNFIIHL